MTDTNQHIFKIPASVYFKAEARDFAIKWAWTLIIPILAFLVLSFFDVRFLIVMLMFLFIVAPMVMVVVYYYIVLSPGLRDALSPMSAEIEEAPDGSVKQICVSVYKSVDDELHLQKTFHIHADRIISTRTQGNYQIIRHYDSDLPLIIIREPLSC